MWPQDQLLPSSPKLHSDSPDSLGQREREKRGPTFPRNSTAVIQKIEQIRDVETECQRHQFSGKQTEAAGEFKRETELNAPQQTFISTYCVPSPEGTFVYGSTEDSRFLVCGWETILFSIGLERGSGLDVARGRV